MLIQETVTTLPADEVIRRAVDFFLATSRHATSVEQRSATHVRFRADVGTVVVAALEGPDGATRVRGCAARQWGLVGRFLTSLGHAGDVRGELARRGERRAEGALVEVVEAPERRLAAA